MFNPLSQALRETKLLIGKLLICCYTCLVLLLVTGSLTLVAKDLSYLCTV